MGVQTRPSTVNLAGGDTADDNDWKFDYYFAYLLTISATHRTLHYGSRLCQSSGGSHARVDDGRLCCITGLYLGD
jgi:hypothetical protein